MLRCPLCRGSNTSPLRLQLSSGQDVPGYFLCSICDIRFLDPKLHLGLDEEHERYRHHENKADDPAYQDFVRPLFDSIVQKLPSRAKGLDFGCGASSALAHLLVEKNFQMSFYDPVFFPNQDILKATTPYDFVVASEVFEHLHDPHAVLKNLTDLLKPGGWLGVMTEMVLHELDFANWYYRRDPTHVVFYSANTFGWMARHWGFSAPEIYGKRVILLKKKTDSA